MKTSIILVFTIITCSLPTVIISQQKISAYVFDSETKMPIDLVAVISSTNNTITNLEGGFTIEINTNDSIKLYHVSYWSHTVSIQQLGDSVFLRAKVYELPEVIIIPRSVIIRELTSLWNNYYKLLKNKKEKDFPKQTFYYRQLTKNDDIYTNYIECFFSAPTTIGVTSLSLLEGRFATIKKDSMSYLKCYLS